MTGSNLDLDNKYREEIEILRLRIDRFATFKHSNTANIQVNLYEEPLLSYNV